MVSIGPRNGLSTCGMMPPMDSGPQPFNRIAPTADEQIARARRGRPRPTLDDRVAAVERQLASLRRQFAAAGVPA